MSGEWGTITDSDWTDDDAVVVCRKLGHFRPGYSTLQALSTSVEQLQLPFFHASLMMLLFYTPILHVD